MQHYVETSPHPLFPTNGNHQRAREDGHETAANTRSGLMSGCVYCINASIRRYHDARTGLRLPVITSARVTPFAEQNENSAS